MQQDQHEDPFRSSQRRRRMLWIVLAHVAVVVAFFAATFVWGNFS
jgi:hypothetical protein